jgi:hypothetical protein
MKMKSLSEMSGFGEHTKRQLAEKFYYKSEHLIMSMLKVQGSLNATALSIEQYGYYKKVKE